MTARKPGAPRPAASYRANGRTPQMADLLGGLGDLIAEARKGGVLTTPEIADILRDAASSMVLS